MGVEIELLEQLKSALNLIQAIMEKLEMNAHGRLKVESTITNYAARVDDRSIPQVTFVGLANPSSSISESESIWRMIRIDETTDVTKVEYADGNLDFDNVWANRLTLNYG
jgi:hypothetical protein